MGTGKRVDMVKGGDAPGPGGYSPKRGVEGPAFSMRTKTALIEKDSAPGPGQYNPADERVKLTSPGCKIGT